MKLVTYEHNGSGPRAGAIVSGGTEIVDLLSANMGMGSSSANEWYANIQSMIEGGDEALHTAYDLIKKAPSSARVAYEDVILHAPVQPPIQIRDCLCFEGHLINAFQNARKMRASQSEDPEAAMAEMEEKGILQVPQTFYEQPIYYKANRFSVVGHDRDVLWPKYSQRLDFELEFGCYIGKLALDVPKEKALDYVYGYTIFNDFTARDAQVAEMGGQLGPAKGKDFDTGNPMGPCLVTADEIPDPYNLTMIARVNGEEWTRGNTSKMYWKFEDLIAHISNSESLYPGEFLGSGTIDGGCGLEHMRFLSPGDVVELEVEGIGILRNRLVKPEE